MAIWLLGFGIFPLPQIAYPRPVRGAIPEAFGAGFHASAGPALRDGIDGLGFRFRLGADGIRGAQEEGSPAFGFAVAYPPTVFPQVVAQDGVSDPVGGG